MIVELFDICPTVRNLNVALRAAKRAMVEGSQLSLEEGLALEQRLFNSLAYTEDVREGLAAFLEKRPAQFKGK